MLLPLHNNLVPFTPPPPKIAGGVESLTDAELQGLLEHQFTFIHRPPIIDYARRSSSLRGLYRVFNDAEYRFYRSTGSPPAETDTPFATAATLPDTPTDTFGDAIWFLSMDFFNGVLSSGFLPLGPNGEAYIRLEVSGGLEQGNPPQDAFSVFLQLRPSGVVRVLALYDESDAAGTRADDFVINATFDGSDPGEDPVSPTAEVSVPSSGLAFLSYDLPAQVHGTTVKVRVQMRRAGALWSENSVILETTADAQGPSAPAGGEAWRGAIPEDS